MASNIPPSHALGPMLCRHEGVILTGGSFSRFIASDTPWMVIEVHREGIEIQKDPRLAARIRRVVNAVLGPFGPGGFAHLATLSKFKPITWRWEQINSISSSERKVITIASKSGVETEFRFGTSGGMTNTFGKLSECGEASSVRIEHPVS